MSIRLAVIAKKLLNLSENSEESEEGQLEHSEIDEVEEFLWNNGDLQEDTLVPMQGPGYRGPHNNNQTVRRPLKEMLYNTKPPRAVPR